MALDKKSETVSLDETDLKIIQLLSQDAKMSYADLGQEIHLTAPAVHGRVKKLERSGVIKKYGIEIDYDRIGLPVTAFVRIQISKGRCRENGQRVSAYPEVLECHSVAGEDDLILKTRTATPLELQNLLDRLKVDGLSDRSISIFVLETHFERPPGLGNL